MTYRERSNRVRAANGWLRQNKIKAFYVTVDGMKFEAGAKALFQATGIGRLAPNVLMMGYKSDWRSCSDEELNSYFDVLQ